MQIGSNVADRCYTPYKTNQNVGYFRGFMQTEKGLVMAEQGSREGGFIEKFVDYQEFHREWMSQPNTDYYFGHAYDVSEMRDESASKIMTDMVQDSRNMTMEEYKQYIHDKISEIPMHPSRMQEMIGTIGFSKNKNYIVGATDKQNAEFQAECQREPDIA